MRKLRKVIGTLLGIWGGIRIVVDVLSSMDATKEYAHSFYATVLASPTSDTLTVAVIVTGLVLLLFHPIKDWWFGAKRPDEAIFAAPAAAGDVIALPSKPSEPEAEPTLISLMNTSFPNLNKLWGKPILTFDDGATLQITSALYFDLFTSGAKFLGFHVPSSPRVLDACSAIAARATELGDALGDGGLKVKCKIPGESPQTLSDLRYSGKVYLYHDDPLTHKQMADVEDMFKAQTLTVVFRGPDFLTQTWVAWKTKQSGNAQPPKLEVVQQPEIDGEVYRLVKSPRVMEWELFKQIYRALGRKDDPAVDTDILVEMYLVNKLTSRTQYIRELRLSAEVDGKRISFLRQPDLFAEEVDGKRFDYGLRERPDTLREDPKPLKQLASELPLALAPGQPAEGWVRFMAKGVNPDKVASGTIVLIVINSVGKEYSIHKVPLERERRGEIGLRRLG